MRLRCTPDLRSKAVGLQPLAECRIGTLRQAGETSDGSVIVGHAVGVGGHQPNAAGALQDELRGLSRDAQQPGCSVLNYLLTTFEVG
jgi:hypothetical protein